MTVLAQHSTEDRKEAHARYRRASTSHSPLIMLLPDQTHSVVTTIWQPLFGPPAQVRHVFVWTSNEPPLGTSGVLVIDRTS